MIEAYLKPGKDIPVALIKQVGLPEEILIASISASMVEADEAIFERFKQLVRDCGTVLALEMTGMPPAAMIEEPRG